MMAALSRNDANATEFPRKFDAKEFGVWQPVSVHISEVWIAYIRTIGIQHTPYKWWLVVSQMLNYVCYSNNRQQMALQATSAANNQAITGYGGSIGAAVLRRQQEQHNQCTSTSTSTTTTTTGHQQVQVLDENHLNLNASRLNQLYSEHSSTAHILQQLQRSSPTTTSNAISSTESSNANTPSSVRTVDGARKRNAPSSEHLNHLLHPFKKRSNIAEPFSLYHQLNKSSPRVTPPAIDLDLGLSFARGPSLTEVSFAPTIAPASGGNYNFNYHASTAEYHRGLDFTTSAAVKNSTRGFVSTSTSPFLDVPPPVTTAPASTQASAAVDFRPYTAHQLASAAHPNVAAYIAGLKCGLVMSGIADSLPTPMLSVVSTYFFVSVSLIC